MEVADGDTARMTVRAPFSASEVQKTNDVLRIAAFIVVVAMLLCCGGCGGWSKSGDEAAKHLEWKVGGPLPSGHNYAVRVYGAPFVIRDITYIVVEGNFTRDEITKWAQDRRFVCTYALRKHGAAEAAIKAGPKVVPEWDTLDVSGEIRTSSFSSKMPNQGYRTVWIWPADQRILIVVMRVNDTVDMVQNPTPPDC